MSFAKQAVSCLLCACVRLCIVLNTHRCRLLISNESSGNLLCGVGTACKLIFLICSTCLLDQLLRANLLESQSLRLSSHPIQAAQGPLASPMNISLVQSLNRCDAFLILLWLSHSMWVRGLYTIQCFVKQQDLLSAVKEMSKHAVVEALRCC